MARPYSNPTNSSRSEPVDRRDRVSEAGEVFTPAHLVEEILDRPSVTSLITDPDVSILEPAAGDGAFIVPITKRRLEVLKDGSWDGLIESLRKIYSVELASDNVEILRRRVRETLRETLGFLSSKEERQIENLLIHNHLEGNFLLRHGGLLPCPPACLEHPKLSFPTYFDLIIGNPPYNPGGLYKDFVTEALATSSRTVFILPTPWKLSSAHKEWRKAVVPHLVTLDDLPRTVFSIKLRTSVVEFDERKTDGFRLNGRPASPVKEEARICDSVLAKAYEVWPHRLKDFQVKALDAARADWPLYLGWKTTVSRTLHRGNSLQTLGFDPADPRLPHNRFSFAFSSQKERAAYLAYSSSKLAAYFQYLTDSDMVAKYLPIPDLTVRSPGKLASDPYLYRTLGLTREEIDRVESMSVFHTAAASEFYEEQGVSLRQDAIRGKRRAACTACGSSSFHRKGCTRSTEKEKTVREGLFGGLL